MTRAYREILLKASLQLYQGFGGRLSCLHMQGFLCSCSFIVPVHSVSHMSHGVCAPFVCLFVSLLYVYS